MEIVLKVVEGPDKGAEVRADKGDVLIGRSGRAQVRLSSEGVSVEHAVIRREGEAFYVENLSAHGTQVNEAKVAGKTRLRFGDKIRVSADTVLRFEAVGRSGVTGRWWLWAVAGILVLVGAAVIFVNPFAERSGGYNVAGAYQILTGWVDGQVASGGLPPETPGLLKDGWRLEEAGDYKAAAGKYWGVQLVLDTGDARGQRVMKAEQEYPHSLRGLLTGKGSAEYDWDELAAALKEFARWRQAECVKKIPDTGF